MEEREVENAMKINPAKSKEIRFTKARVKDSLNYSLKKGKKEAKLSRYRPGRALGVPGG
jgi:hypothetical protein